MCTAMPPCGSPSGVSAAPLEEVSNKLAQVPAQQWLLSVPVQYKEQLESLRSKVVEDMETVKRRDNLDFVEVRGGTIAAPCVL